jgi:hypothetical protein
MDALRQALEGTGGKVTVNWAAVADCSSALVPGSLAAKKAH